MFLEYKWCTRTPQFPFIPTAMYIGWIHHYIPKLFAGLAFLVNPLFVYLVFTEKTNSFGNYRFLLLYFAIFNVVYSSLEVAVPIVSLRFSSVLAQMERSLTPFWCSGATEKLGAIFVSLHLSFFGAFVVQAAWRNFSAFPDNFQGIDGYRYCFFLFLTDGSFVQPSTFHHYVLTTRCSMLACSYAVLISHFIYRLLVLNRSKFTNTRFPSYMAYSLALCGAYFLCFAWVCERLLYPNQEVKQYIRQDFLEKYGVDIENHNIMVALFNVSRFALERECIVCFRKDQKQMFGGVGVEFWF